MPRLFEDQEMAGKREKPEDIVMVCGDFGPGGAAKAPITRHGDALLNAAGWCVNHKRLERIRRREGLKVPQKQKKRGRLRLNDGSPTLASGG